MSAGASAPSRRAAPPFDVRVIRGAYPGDALHVPLVRRACEKQAAIAARGA